MHSAPAIDLPFLFFPCTKALALTFPAPLGWAQRACLGLIREAFVDTGVTLNMSWHNASAPSCLSGRSRIAQSRLGHLMLLFFFFPLCESEHWGNLLCLCVCVLQIGCQKFYISLSALIADVVPPADSLQWNTNPPKKQNRCSRNVAHLQFCVIWHVTYYRTHHKSFEVEIKEGGNGEDGGRKLMERGL